MTSPEKSLSSKGHCRGGIGQKEPLWLLRRKGVNGIWVIPIEKVFFWGRLTVFSVIFYVSIKMSFYEPRLDVMGWFRAIKHGGKRGQNSGIGLKTQKRQIRSGGGPRSWKYFPDIIHSGGNPLIFLFLFSSLCFFQYGHFLHWWLLTLLLVEPFLRTVLAVLFITGSTLTWPLCEDKDRNFSCMTFFYAVPFSSQYLFN